jgi:DivIVA domain-containing protein
VNEDPIEKIRYSQFRVTGFRAGYDIDEVDHFLDGLMAALERGDDVSGLVDGARFSRVKRKGYEMSEVDALLDRIAGRPTGRALRSTVETDSPAVVQEQQGLLGRLFGHRR